MFKCYECNEVFDKPDEVEEDRGEFWGIPCTETMSYCPHCGSEAIREVYYFDVFGTPICEGEVFYDFGNGKIANENLEAHLADCHYIA